MINPVIILGAGASYDYFPNQGLEKISPLTKELINQKYLHKHSLKEYPEAGSLFSDITARMLNQKKTFEEALREIKEEGGEHKHIKEQLVSLEYYLQNLFRDISGFAQPINNYNILISKIKTFNSGHAHVVTLNYDTLFEQCEGDWNKMSSYISKPIKVIKLHGSHDWVYIQNRAYLGYANREDQDSYNFYKSDPSFLDKVTSTENWEPIHREELNHVGSESGFYITLPAIAVPLPNKKRYVCPKSHVESLKQALSVTDRILTIGWSGGDDNLIDLIKNNTHNPVTITVVSHSLQSVEAIIENLKIIKNANFVKYTNGFSGFVSGDEINNFFKVSKFERYPEAKLE